MRIRGFMVLVSLLVMLLGAGAAQAAESWVTDPRTGAKVGWVHDFYILTAASWSGPITDGKADGSGKLTVTLRIGKSTPTVQIEGEMQRGLLHGKASGVWSDGDSFQGSFVNGVAEGKAVVKYATRGGRVFEGEYSNNLPNGHGVYKEANGKVIYEGEWRDGVPATRPALDRVLGIPWGSSEAEVKKAMLARPNTKLQWAGKEAGADVQRYWGPFNNENHFITACFNEGKLFLVEFLLLVPEMKLDEAMTGFDNMRKGLTEKYGPPDIETGKYLDTVITWAWPGKNAIRLTVGRYSANPPMFGLRLVYIEASGYLKYEEKSAPAGGKTEY